MRRVEPAGARPVAGAGRREPAEAAARSVTSARHDHPTRVFLESGVGVDFSRVPLRAGTRSGRILLDDPASAAERHAESLADRATRVVGHAAVSGPTQTLQRQISPEDVSTEMIGVMLTLTAPFSHGGVQLAAGDPIVVVAWSNTSPTVRVRIPTPLQHAGAVLDVPKRLLGPGAPSGARTAPYGVGLAGVVRDVERGEQAIEAERTRSGGPRPGEIARREALQSNRQRLLNRRLIQAVMFNRFDAAIERWTDHYNAQLGKGMPPLDPNLVKSMLFQESQLGTAGQHLELTPSHPVRTRFNLAQVIDSSGLALLTIMGEVDPTLFTTYHLGSLRADLGAAQRELAALQANRHRTSTEDSRLVALLPLSARNWEVFIWGYRAAGQSVGFSEAADALFAVVGGGVPRNLDYEFWIRTAIRWLFEKRRSVSSWAEAIRAYNGSGARAEHYRDAVVRRAQEATSAQRRGREFVPGAI